MKIVKEQEEIELRKIKMGETFLHEGKLHMKVDKESLISIFNHDDYSTILNLETNKLFDVCGDMEVQPMEAEIRILHRII